MTDGTKRSRHRLWIIVLAIPPLLIVGGIVALNIWAKHTFVSQEYRFRLHDSPPFLTEVVALKCGRDALSADGYDAARWGVIEVDRPHFSANRTKAPDGTTDVYLSRNQLDPKKGVLVFHSKDDERRIRFVNVEIQGDTVSCWISQPK